MTGGNDLFAINEKTGVVFTRKTLDREDSRNQENGAYILEIQATEISKIKVGGILGDKDILHTDFIKFLSRSQIKHVATAIYINRNHYHTDGCER